MEKLNELFAQNDDPAVIAKIILVIDQFNHNLYSLQWINSFKLQMENTSMEIRAFFSMWKIYERMNSIINGRLSFT